MQNSKKSKGVSCRIDCPVRIAKLRDAKQSTTKKSRANRHRYRRKPKCLVYQPEEETLHEPYMQPLKNQFGSKSIECDSNIEIPWQDIAVMNEGKKPRDNEKLHDSTSPENNDFANAEEVESTRSMVLPWEDLVIEEIVSNVSERRITEIPNCDSLEIPWKDLTLEEPLKVEPLPEIQACPRDNIEVPWDAILVPADVIIKPKVRKKHPSSGTPSGKVKKRIERRNCTGNCSRMNK